MTGRNRYATCAWGVLSYNVLVILWGAFVRATGSGAGCGSHWPLCNGEVVPTAPEVATLIELAHRLSSGLAGLLVLALWVWAFRAYPRGHLVRQGAACSLVFILLEGAIGAGLVLFEWVAHDASLGRILSMGLHLNNTLFLLGALTLTAWWASGGPALRIRRQGTVGRLVFLGLASLLVVGTAGAVTALGDTLFRPESLAQGLQQDFAASAHFLERLRVWHPVLAVTAGVYLIGTVRYVMDRRPGVNRLGHAVIGLLLVQLAAGALNLFLLAPVWMQLVHLLLADLIWITLVLFAAAALAVPVASDADLPRRGSG